MASTARAELWEAAELSVSEGDALQAIGRLEQLCREYPTDQEGLVYLADLLNAADRRAEAARYLERVLLVHPEHRSAANLLWSIRLGEPDDGVDRALKLRGVAELAGEQPELWRQLALYLGEEGRRHDAIEAWRRVLDQDPQDGSALLQLVSLSCQLGRRGDGQRYLKRFLAAHPQSADQAVELAAQLALQGEADAARALCGALQGLGHRVPDVEARLKGPSAPTARRAPARLESSEPEAVAGFVKSVRADFERLVDGIAQPKLRYEVLSRVSEIISERDPRLLPLEHPTPHGETKGQGQSVERLVKHLRVLISELPAELRDSLLKQCARILADQGIHLLAIQGSVWLPREMRAAGSDDAFSALHEELASEGRTLLDPERLYVLWQAVQNTVRFASPSLEIGVYRGGASAFLSRAYTTLTGRSREHHAIDTFEGHSELDLSESDLHEAGFFEEASFQDVSGFLATIPGIQVHKGRFAEVAASLEVPRYSLIHVDTDLYGPTGEALAFAADRLEIGGVVVVDDYLAPKCPGVAQAVHEFLASPPGEGFQAWSTITEQAVLTRMA
jgi:tetratricopeptide (TPR) repeat protein